MDAMSWLDALREILLGEDERACGDLLRDTTPRRGASPVVRLLTGDLEVDEALAYARVLFDLGQPDDGDDVLLAVVHATCGVSAFAIDARVAAVA